MEADFTETVVAKMAGVAGALSSLAFVKGTLPARLSMATAGAVLSLYASPWMSGRTGLPIGLSGYLLG